MPIQAHYMSSAAPSLVDARIRYFSRLIKYLNEMSQRVSQSMPAEALDELREFLSDSLGVDTLKLDNEFERVAVIDALLATAKSNFEHYLSFQKCMMVPEVVAGASALAILLEWKLTHCAQKSPVENGIKLPLNQSLSDRAQFAFNEKETIRTLREIVAKLVSSSHTQLMQYVRIDEKRQSHGRGYFSSSIEVVFNFSALKMHALITEKKIASEFERIKTRAKSRVSATQWQRAVESAESSTLPPEQQATTDSMVAATLKYSAAQTAAFNAVQASHPKIEDYIIGTVRHLYNLFLSESALLDTLKQTTHNSNKLLELEFKQNKLIEAMQASRTRYTAQCDEIKWELEKRQSANADEHIEMIAGYLNLADAALTAFGETLSELESFKLTPGSLPHQAKRTLTLYQEELAYQAQLFSQNHQLITKEWRRLDILAAEKEENKRQEKQKAQLLKLEAETNAAVEASRRFIEEQKTKLDARKQDIQAARDARNISRAELAAQAVTTTTTTTTTVVAENQTVVARLENLNHTYLDLIEDILSQSTAKIKYNQVRDLIVTQLGGEIKEIGNGSSHKRIKLMSRYSELCTTSEAEVPTPSVATGGMFKQHGGAHTERNLCRFNVCLIKEVLESAGITLGYIQSLRNPVTVSRCKA